MSHLAAAKADERATLPSAGTGSWREAERILAQAFCPNANKPRRIMS
jgi:hypothetical protein